MSEAVENRPPDGFGALLPEVTEPLGHRSKAADVGEEECPVDKLPGDLSLHRIGHDAVDNIDGQQRADSLDQADQRSDALFQQLWGRRQEIELQRLDQRQGKIGAQVIQIGF